jgi:Zn-dependent M28 family amino/carboxypeptidase
MRKWLVAAALFHSLTSPVLSAQPAGDDSASLADVYRRDAGQIMGAALTDVEGWEKLTYLATIIGHRMSGSVALEQAIDWAAETMESEGLVVRKQPVMVPHWVRGEESASVVSPVERELPILGLGRSVGTPEGGITAPVVVVGSFDELEALGRENVEGKIVVYAVDWEGYGRTVRYRGAGASRAAALGAVAALVRSATGLSVASPHTGAMRYDEEQPQIPAAAITVEDAMWMRNMAKLGQEMTVHLEMGAQTLPDAQSYNVIAEIAGREIPEEVVVMGGHYDSWDVGQGVHDDGAACIAAWQALKLIHDLGLQPRRTLRVVLWTNEEIGLRGGRTYSEELSDEEVANHVAAIEMDGGAERPRGFGFGLVGVDPEAEDPDPAYEAALTRLEQIGSLFGAIEAAEILRGGGGADIGPLMRSGVPGLGLRTVGEHYFDWHHTHGDTLDKVNVEDFRRAMAMLGVMGYVLADMPERLVPAVD